MQICRSTKPLLLAIFFFSQSVLAEEWMLIHETNVPSIYAQASAIYLDKASLTSGNIEGGTYISARTKQVEKNKASSYIEDVAVVCQGSSIAPALYIQRMGNMLANGEVSFSRDSGPPKTFDSFNFKNMNIKQPISVFSIVAKAVCEQQGSIKP